MGLLLSNRAAEHARTGYLSLFLPAPYIYTPAYCAHCAAPQAAFCRASTPRPLRRRPPSSMLSLPATPHSLASTSCHDFYTWPHCFLLPYHLPLYRLPCPCLMGLGWTGQGQGHFLPHAASSLHLCLPHALAHASTISSMNIFLPFPRHLHCAPWPACLPSFYTGSQHSHALGWLTY